MYGLVTSVFNDMAMGRNHCDPSTFAVYQYRFLRAFRCHYFPCNATQSKFASWIVIVQEKIQLNTVSSEFTKLVVTLVEIIANGLKCLVTDLGYFRNVLRMCRWLNDVPGSTLKQRLPKLSIQLHSHKSPVQMNNGAMPAMFTTLQLATCNPNDLIDLMNSFLSGSMKFLLIKLWLGPYWVRLPTAK